MSIKEHETMKAIVNRYDAVDCEACGDVEYEPCLYHQGVADGYAMAVDVLERAR